MFFFFKGFPKESESLRLSSESFDKVHTFYCLQNVYQAREELSAFLLIMLIRQQIHN
jgi:hypothetical protein